MFVFVYKEEEGTLVRWRVSGEQFKCICFLLLKFPEVKANSLKGTTIGNEKTELQGLVWVMVIALNA